MGHSNTGACMCVQALQVVAMTTEIVDHSRSGEAKVIAGKLLL